MKYFSPIFILFCTSLAAQQPDYEPAARVAYFSGQYEEALTAIQHCIDRDTANYQYLFLKGRTLENLYRYDEAIATQHKALRLNANSIEARAALAALYLLSGQPAISAEFYEQLTTAEPSVNRWKMNWATALQAAGKPKDALEQLKIVEQTDTTNWVIYKNMGDCYFRLDSLWQTYGNYYYALQLYPQNKNLWGTLTRILATNDETEGAIEIGNKAVKIDTTNLEAWKYLGFAYYTFGDATNGYTAFGKALALGDSTFTTISHYGILNYLLAQSKPNTSYSYYRNAEKYLEKAHQMRPKELSIMNYLASTYRYTGKAQKGLDIIDEIDKIVANYDTIGMKANIQRGHLLRGINRNNDAANVFITATKDFPKDDRIFYEVAICYDRALNKKLAYEWYTRYLEKIDLKWSTRQWTEQELKKHEFVSTAMERVQTLKMDLFFEGEKVKN